MALALTKRSQYQASIMKKCSKTKLNKMSNVYLGIMGQNNTYCNNQLFICNKRSFALVNDDDDFGFNKQRSSSALRFNDENSNNNNNKQQISSGGKRQGIVKWFDSVKGYGFITDEKSNEDYFVHYRNLFCNSRFKSVEQGSSVEFEIGKGNNGKSQALNVTGPNGAAVTPDNQQSSQNSFGERSDFGGRRGDFGGRSNYNRDGSGSRDFGGNRGGNRNMRDRDSRDSRDNRNNRRGGDSMGFGSSTSIFDDDDSMDSGMGFGGSGNNKRQFSRDNNNNDDDDFFGDNSNDDDFFGKNDNDDAFDFENMDDDDFPRQK